MDQDDKGQHQRQQGDKEGRAGQHTDAEKNEDDADNQQCLKPPDPLGLPDVADNGGDAGDQYKYGDDTAGHNSKRAGAE